MNVLSTFNLHPVPTWLILRRTFISQIRFVTYAVYNTGQEVSKQFIHVPRYSRI